MTALLSPKAGLWPFVAVPLIAAVLDWRLGVILAIWAAAWALNIRLDRKSVV